MKRRTLILLLAALVASAAGCSQTRKSIICAGPGGMESYAADQEVHYYAEAVETLGEQLANRLKTPPRKNYGPSVASYYILNADADNGTETELARRFIDDLTDELANEGIRLKRQEMLGWPRITGNEMAVECEEVLRQAAADHFLEFSLVDCPDAFDCKIAKIRLVDGCNILLTEENAFFLKGNPLDWSKKMNELEPKIGEPNAPYEDFDEAARQMVGRIACFLNHMLPDRSGIRIVVGKTDRTSEDAAVAVSHAVSFFGFQEVIPSNSRYMKVAMDTQSGFQLGMYEARKYPDYAAANVVVAFDVAPVSSRLVQAKITVLALEDIAIIDNGAIQTVKNGMVLPKCVADGYVKMRHTAYSTAPPDDCRRRKSGICRVGRRNHRRRRHRRLQQELGQGSMASKRQASRETRRQGQALAPAPFPYQKKHRPRPLQTARKQHKGSLPGLHKNGRRHIRNLQRKNMHGNGESRGQGIGRPPRLDFKPSLPTPRTKFPNQWRHIRTFFRRFQGKTKDDSRRLG